MWYFHEIINEREKECLFYQRKRNIDYLSSLINESNLFMCSIDLWLNNNILNFNFLGIKCSTNAYFILPRNMIIDGCEKKIIMKIESSEKFFWNLSKTVIVVNGQINQKYLISSNVVLLTNLIVFFKTNDKKKTKSIFCK